LIVKCLFESNIFGEPRYHSRHVRAFDAFAAEYARLQQRRSAAFRDTAGAGI
jgi:hypothetical protein